MCFWLVNVVVPFLQFQTIGAYDMVNAVRDLPNKCCGTLDALPISLRKAVVDIIAFFIYLTSTCPTATLHSTHHD